jgi:uncharacterized protein YndB with AHSA1/START domain
MDRVAPPGPAPDSARRRSSGTIPPRGTACSGVLNLPASRTIRACGFGWNTTMSWLLLVRRETERRRSKETKNVSDNATKTARKAESQITSAAGTVRLHRFLKAPPERVYKAFLDPDAMAKWLPPHGFTGKVHKMDATVGGGYKMSFTNFGTGQTHSFGGTYLELTPHQRIRYTDQFDDPSLPGKMHVTIELRKVMTGTELNIVQEGLPPQIPVEFAYLGWQESLTLLAKVVEPEISAAP